MFVAALASTCAFAAVAAVPGFGFDDVDRRAKAAAAAPFVKSSNALPKELQELTYDQYRDIRYKPDRACGGAQSCPSSWRSFTGVFTSTSR